MASYCRADICCSLTGWIQPADGSSPLTVNVSHRLHVSVRVHVRACVCVDVCVRMCVCVCVRAHISALSSRSTQ